MTFRGQSPVTYVIWIVLIGAFVVALAGGRWSLAFVSVATLALSLVPVLVAERFNVRLPISFVAGIVFFVFATVFLGEAFDFYERYAWWDIALHGGAAMGFGLVGFIFVYVLFAGDRYAAPHWALAFIAFALAVTMGALWEIFEFAMDQIFGLTMQKSGLVDTMWDLIVNAGGGLLGAGAGFAYLRGSAGVGLAGVIHEFVERNRRFFPRNKR